MIFLPGLQLWVKSEPINVMSGRHPAGRGSNWWIGLCHVPSEARAFDYIAAVLAIYLLHCNIIYILQCFNEPNHRYIYVLLPTVYQLPKWLQFWVQSASSGASNPMLHLQT